MKLNNGTDYYIDEKSGLLVMTKEYLYNRGYCCGNGCKNCVYIPKHTKSNTNIDPQYLLEKLENDKNRN